MGITVSHSAMLAHCHALTQACGYTEGEQDTAFTSQVSIFHFALYVSSVTKKNIQLVVV